MLCVPLLYLIEDVWDGALAAQLQAVRRIGMKRPQSRPQGADPFRRVGDLVERIRVTPKPTTRGVRVLISVVNAPRVYLNDPEASLYNETLSGLVGCFSPDPLDPAISAHEVKELLNGVIVGSLGEAGQGQPTRTRDFAGRLNVQLLALRRALEAPPSDWMVYLPLRAPLALRTRKFGQVQFVPAQSRALRTQLDRLGAHEVETSFKEAAAVAKVAVKAKDGSAAHQRALRIVRIAIDVLDFIGPTLDVPYREPLATFESVELPGRSAVVAVGPAHSSWRTISFGIRIGRLDRLARGRSALFRAASQLLRTPESDLACRLVTAMAWAGRARVQRRADQAFLLNMIALESALSSPDSRESTTDRVRQRTAHVIGGHLNQRLAAHREMRRLYRLRSAIVHTGAAGLMQQDQTSLEQLVRKVLSALTTKRPFSVFRTAEELELWFHEQTLAGTRAMRR